MFNIRIVFALIFSLFVIGCGEQSSSLPATGGQRENQNSVTSNNQVSDIDNEHIKSASNVAGVAVNSSENVKDVVNQLSYCAAIHTGQSLLLKQSGDVDPASTLEKSGFAFSRTAIEFGMSNGLSEPEVASMLKNNSSKLTEEMRNKNFFDASFLNEKNNNCVNTLKNNSTLLWMWYRYNN